MEVKVPIGSSYMYRHVSSIAQKRWRIALIYRGAEIILPKAKYNDTTKRYLANRWRSKRTSKRLSLDKTREWAVSSPFGSNIYTLIDMRSMSKRAS